MASGRLKAPGRSKRPAGPSGFWPAPGEFFTDVFENATDIILVNDREGRIVAANRAARTFAGYTLDDLDRGLTLRDVLAPADHEPAMALTRQALAGEPFPEMYEREAVLRDGSRRIMEVRSNVLRRDGQPYALQTIARDVTEQREAAKFQRGMLDLAEALLTAGTIVEAAQIVCEKGKAILDVDGACIWLHRGADELESYGVACPAPDCAVGRRRKVCDSLVGAVYAAGEVVIANDFAQSAFAGQHSAGIPVASMIGVPLRRHGPPAGVLVFADSTRPQLFSGPVRERALLLGAAAAAAVDSALAHGRLAEEAEVSGALLRVAQAIRESLAEEEVVPQIARSAREVVGCDWAGVALWHERTGVLRVSAVEGLSRQASEELKLIDLREGGFGTGLGIIRRLLNGDVVEQVQRPEVWPEILERWGIGSMLAVPMLRAGRVAGALGIGFREPRSGFSVRERRLAEGIAAQAAVAVEHARLVEDLRRASAQKTELLGVVSHELRTPLSAILGYADLLREGALGPILGEQADALERLVVNGQGLVELINTTLHASRLDAGRVGLQISEFDLHEVVEQVRREFEVRAQTAKAVLTWPPAAAMPPLRTDRGKLKAVVRNLVDNALKFTPDGAVAVAVRYSPSIDWVAVSVRDTGIGIPAEALGSIFEMFGQVPGARATSRSGVGLGLYLVRRYAELMGGRVTVRSTMGQGSEFVLEIPRQVSGKA